MIVIFQFTNNFYIVRLIQFKGCLTIGTQSSLQKTIMKLLKQAQEKVDDAKKKVEEGMDRARGAVRKAQKKVASWRAGIDISFLLFYVYPSRLLSFFWQQAMVLSLSKIYRHYFFTY